MTARYSVVWTHVAEGDFDAILDYLARESPNAAARCLSRVRRTARSLVQLPTRGRVVPELAEYGLTQYRELVVKPWRVIYEILGGKVVVVAVIDGRRNVEDILLERLIRSETNPGEGA